MKTGWRKKLAAAGLAGVIAIGSSAAHAEGLMDQAMGDGLNVAFYNFKPYAYTDDSGVLTGTDVDTLKAVLERLGGGIADAKAIEWGALIPGVKSERFDVVAAGMFVTPKRCAEVRFSEPTFGIQQSLIVMKGNPHGVSDYDSIAEMGLTVAVISGLPRQPMPGTRALRKPTSCRFPTTRPPSPPCGPTGHRSMHFRFPEAAKW